MIKGSDVYYLQSIIYDPESDSISSDFSGPTDPTPLFENDEAGSEAIYRAFYNGEVPRPSNTLIAGGFVSPGIIPSFWHGGFDQNPWECWIEPGTDRNIFDSTSPKFRECGIHVKPSSNLVTFADLVPLNPLTDGDLDIGPGNDYLTSHSASINPYSTLDGSGNHLQVTFMESWDLSRTRIMVDVALNEHFIEDQQPGGITCFDTHEQNDAAG